MTRMQDKIRDHKPHPQRNPMARLYEYAVVLNPKTDENGKATEKPRMIVDVTRVLADSDREVGIKAARAIPEDLTDRLDEIEVVIRPF